MGKQIQSSGVSTSPQAILPKLLPPTTKGMEFSLFGKNYNAGTGKFTEIWDVMNLLPNPAPTNPVNGTVVAAGNPTVNNPTALGSQPSVRNNLTSTARNIDLVGPFSLSSANFCIHLVYSNVTTSYVQSQALFEILSANGEKISLYPKRITTNKIAVAVNGALSESTVNAAMGTKNIVSILYNATTKVMLVYHNGVEILNLTAITLAPLVGTLTLFSITGGTNPSSCQLARFDAQAIAGTGADAVIWYNSLNTSYS
jgi:hypothetical protein